MDRIKVDIGRQIPPLEQFDKQIINFKNLKQDMAETVAAKRDNRSHEPKYGFIRRLVIEPTGVICMTAQWFEACR